MLKWLFSSGRESEISYEDCGWEREDFFEIPPVNYFIPPRSYSSRRRKSSDVPDNAKVFESKLTFCTSQTFYYFVCCSIFLLLSCENFTILVIEE